MDINISARHGSISEEVRQKITEKVERLSRIVDRVSKIEVTLELEKTDSPTVVIFVGTELKKDFTSTCSSDNLLVCVDLVVDKIENQMRKFKEKMTSHQ